MSLFANIESSVTNLEKVLFSKKLSAIKSTGKQFGLAKEIGLALAAAQNVFNHFELSISMLRNNENHNERLVTKIESELFGPYEPYDDDLVDVNENYQSVYIYDVDSISHGGINVIINFLNEALLHEHNTYGFAGCVYSAQVAFQPIIGALERLKSRLQWTVMYPDSFTKDSALIQNKMIIHGFEEVWNQLAIAIENYLSTDFQASCNALRNALTHFVKGLAQKYNVDENQFGTQRTNLVKIGFIDSNFSDTISKFFGHLSKFSKAHDSPSALESQFLVDMALSVFGFLVTRIDEFTPKKESKKISKA